jgi:pseudouridine kinase
VVGDDNEGREVISHLRRLGIDTKDILILNNHSTAHYDVILDKQGEMYLALADMAIFDSIPFQRFTESWSQWEEDDLVFLDTNLPQNVIEHAIQVARTKNIRLCVDPVSVSKSKKLPDSLEQVYLIKPDRLEAESMTGLSIRSPSDCVKAGQMLLNRGVENCVISLGKDGYVLVTSVIQKHVPAKKMPAVVDVSGAGDAFIAGMLYQLSQNNSIQDACELGEAAALLTLQSCHTVNETITISDLKNLINQHQACLTLAEID